MQNDPEQLAQRISEAALAMKADGLRILDLRPLASFTDFFVVCSGASDRQVQAIADQVQENLRAISRRPIGVEGYDAAQWILLDYGSVVVHIFYPEARDFYQIEKLWADAPELAAHGS